MIRIFEDLPVDAGFTCKPADGKVYRSELLKKAPVVRLSLVHGSEIAVIRSMQPEGAAPLRADTDEGYLDVYDADGAVTDLPGVYLTTTHGDCVPIWTCDPVKGVVGVAHAGWRGTASGIAPAAVRVRAIISDQTSTSFWVYPDTMGLPVVPEEPWMRTMSFFGEASSWKG